MSFQKTIHPRFGVNRYRLYGCTAFELDDPNTEFSMPNKEILGFTEFRKLAKQLKEVGQIQCYKCRYLRTRACVYTFAMIQEKEHEYRTIKMRCYYCNHRLRNFQEFLLNVTNSRYVCQTCETAMQDGTLVEKLKKELKPQWLEIAKGVGEVSIAIIPLVALAVKGIQAGTPQFGLLATIGVLIIAIGLLIGLSGKSRRVKKLRIQELQENFTSFEMKRPPLP